MYNTIESEIFMKKKKVIIIAVLLLIVLVIPVKLHYKDGGTIEYKSLTYKIIKWHRLDDYYDTGYKTGTEIHFFPNNFKPIDYFEEVKPPRFSLIYKDKIFLSQVLSFQWKNEYNSVIADSSGPTEIDYKDIINANKNEELYYGVFLPITSIKLYDENGIVDYNVEYSDEDETIKVPDLNGTYYLEVYYNCPEGYVHYAFKLNIS